MQQRLAVKNLYLVLILLVSSLGSPSNGAWAETQSEPMPSMALPLLNGEVGLIEPDPERNTLVYFFAPWCGVCKLSIGNLAYVNPETTRVVVVALDFVNARQVRNFIDRTELNVPVFLGDDATMMRFHIKAFPTYFILDSEFRVVTESVGYSTALGLKLRT